MKATILNLLPNDLIIFTEIIESGVSKTIEFPEEYFEGVEAISKNGWCKILDVNGNEVKDEQQPVTSMSEHEATVSVNIEQGAGDDAVDVSTDVEQGAGIETVGVNNMASAESTTKKRGRSRS